MSEEQRQKPQINEDAVLGHWILKKGEQASKAGRVIGTEGSKAAKEGAKLGQKGLGALGTFMQNRGADIIAYGATTIVLTVRGFFNAIDYLAEKVAKPIARAYRNWEPKTPVTQNIKKGLDTVGGKIANGYRGYVNFFGGFDYPKSLPAMVGLGAIQGVASVTGIHYSHEVLHTISTGHASALHYIALPTLIAAGKGSNLLTLKPALKLAKTTKEGFFSSDLYKDKLKPVYMKNFDPWVQLTKEHIQEWDDMIENRVEAYRKFKENMKNQGQMKERVKGMADTAQTKLSNGVNSLKAVFGTSANEVPEPAIPALPVKPAAKPTKMAEFNYSKLDGASLKPHWTYVFEPEMNHAATTEPDASPTEPTRAPE